MNTFRYEVVSIDGDYANLRRIDEKSDETKLPSFEVHILK